MTALTKIEAKPFNVVADIEDTQRICATLLKTPHYAKMGEVGIWTVVQKAKSVGMNPLDALNGDMYFVQGKVEMNGQAMLAIIRSHGHSVSMDPTSTETKVIMYGKRCDNGDAWRAEFSVEDAKKAGIYRNQWEKQPRVMCMWRCVSQLGRFLFSDILKGVYVKGEISESIASGTPILEDDKIEYASEVIPEKVEPMKISQQAANELRDILSGCSPEYQKIVDNFMVKQGINSLEDLPMLTYPKIRNKATEEKKAFSEKIKLELESRLSEVPRSMDEVLDDQS